MNKQWYINVDGKNKGPFSTTEILNLFRSGELSDFTLCWKEGFPSWIPYFQLELDALEMKLPELPGIPETTGLPPLPSNELDQLPDIPNEESFDPLDDYSEVSLDNYHDDKGFAEPLHVEIADSPVDTNLNNYEDDFNQSVFPVYSFAASVVLTLSFIIFTYLILIPSSKRSVIFQNVSMETLKYLEGKIDKDKFYIKFGLDKSGEVIFGRSNLSKNANVRVLFERVAETDAFDKISFTTSAIIKDGDLKFDDFDFIAGEKIEQGRYKVKASARIEDSLDRLKNFILGRVGEFEFEEDVYLIPSTLEEYKNSLSKIIVSTKLEQEEVLLNLEQKIQTVDSILTSMALHYRLSINLSSGKKASAEFEKRYHSQSGPLLQSIILEDYEKLFSKSEQKLNLQEFGAKIHILSKDIAALSAQLSQELKTIKKLSPKIRINLRDQLSIRVNELKQITEEVKSDISLEIKEVKASI